MFLVFTEKVRAGSDVFIDRIVMVVRGNDDPTTRRMMEDILAVEEEHADDMANRLEGFTGSGQA